MKTKLILGAAAAGLLAVTVACSPTKPIIHPGDHLDSVNHSAVSSICHEHATTHCHDLRSGKENRTAWW